MPRRKMCFRGCKCDPCQKQRKIDRGYIEARTGNPLEYPSAQSVRRRATKYKLNLDQLQAMREAQQDRCAICGREETVLGSTGKVKSLAIDHDHETDHIRGLLCNNCNRGIGLLGKEVGLLERAVEYLKRGKMEYRAGGGCFTPTEEHTPAAQAYLDTSMDEVS